MGLSADDTSENATVCFEDAVACISSIEVVGTAVKVVVQWPILQKLVQISGVCIFVQRTVMFAAASESCVHSEDCRTDRQMAAAWFQQVGHIKIGW
jgi:hypothetical protein